MNVENFVLKDTLSNLENLLEHTIIIIHTCNQITSLMHGQRICYIMHYIYRYTSTVLHKAMKNINILIYRY